VSTLAWILVAGVAMSAVALIGGVTALSGAGRQRTLILALVAFAAGALLGGALFHMLPLAVELHGPGIGAYAWLAAGFLAFFCLEQFLYWHHCHEDAHPHRQPLGYLVLAADSLHNFLCGLAVGAVFLIDVRLGWTAWAAAAAHELPQELGDFGVLRHAGWSTRRALLLNVASALTFPLGGAVAWTTARDLDVSVPIAFGAGSFLYIAAADLIPEVKGSPRLGTALLHFACVAAGVGLLALLSVLAPEPH
jgi:zinc and cadmium transporter